MLHGSIPLASVIYVEDNDLLREVTVDFLQESGFDVRGVPDGESLDEALAQAPAAAVVLDIDLPGEDGLSLCRRLRENSPRMGIIMLTALGAAGQRVTAYQQGADIYLTKPTSHEELAAALLSLQRRLTLQAPTDSLVASSRDLSLTGPSGRQSLTDPEMKILRGLAMAAQRQLEYWQLMSVLGMEPTAEAKSALEVRIVRLRKKLLAAGAQEPAIKSIRRLGYQLTTGVVLE